MSRTFIFLFQSYTSHGGEIITLFVDEYYYKSWLLHQFRILKVELTASMR